MKQYRLGSNEMVSAPGMVQWAINGAHFESDRAQMIKVIADGWHLPQEAATALVLQQVPYTIEDETVVFAYQAKD
jgi:hypothetical protein